MTDALSSILVGALNERNNPTDLKPSIIGLVVSLTPLTVSLDEGKRLLTEGSELFISEWFRFRCDIDKTKVLSEIVPTDRMNSAASNTSAKGVTEIHSAVPKPCEMPESISFLAASIDSLSDAILQINTELLALKCDLKIGDLVCIESLEQKHKYLVTDKVLNDVSD